MDDLVRMRYRLAWVCWVSALGFSATIALGSLSGSYPSWCVGVAAAQLVALVLLAVRRDLFRESPAWAVAPTFVGLGPIAALGVVYGSTDPLRRGLNVAVLVCLVVGAVLQLVSAVKLRSDATTERVDS